MTQCLRPILILLLLFNACTVSEQPELPEHIRDIENLTAYPADIEPEYQITLTQVETYGNPEEVLIGRMGPIVVDEAGRVYIYDVQRHGFHIFGTDGRYLTRLGREGRGPGEFAGYLDAWIHSNRLYVFDRRLLRVSVFSPNSYELIRTIDMSPVPLDTSESQSGYYLFNLYPRSDSTFIGKYNPINYQPDPREPGYNFDSLSQDFFLLSDRNTILSDRILQLEGIGEPVFLTGLFQGRYIGNSFGFMPKSIMAIFSDNHFFTIWTDDMLVREYDPEGTYLRAFYHPYQKAGLTQKEAMDLYEGEYNQQILSQNELPETWPAVDRMLIDDQDRLWIAAIVEDRELYEWWVLNRRGELKARFTWPREQQIELIKNGQVYTLETEEQTGIQQVVRYRIEMSIK